MPDIFYVAMLIVCFHGDCTRFESAPYSKNIGVEECQKMLKYTFQTQVGPYYDNIIDFEKDKPEDVKITYAGCDTTQRRPEDSNDWKIIPDVNKDLIPNQEKFAQSYILHRNATEAARAAGYSKASAYNQGYRLLQNDEVKERIEDLEKELTTDVDVVAEIENQYTFAKANGHTNSAIKALELLSRVRGAKSDKELDMTTEELESNIIESLKVLGKEKVTELIKKCDF